MERLQQIESWLKQHFPQQSFTLAPASADASFRRYFRATFDDGSTRIVMDAPPQHEDCKPFIHVSQLFHTAGVHVPEVLAQDLERGFLLLTDLGNPTYLSQLNAQSMKALYLDAIDALIKIQLASKPDELPPYDQALLQHEMNLFEDWYVNKHLGIQLNEEQKGWLTSSMDAILANNLAQGQVYVHRDYHSRNLMITQPNPGILDFQDAVYGPITYDLVSLLRDAYIEWTEQEVLDMFIRCWERAKKAGLPVHDDASEFYKDFELMGAQRQIKVIGIFTRLCHRDGKDGYLKDIPLVMQYLRKTCERYIALGPLLKLLNQLEGTEVKVGYTF